MSLQNIHTAMGSLAYAVAKADGKVQDEERAILIKLAQEEFDLHSDADYEWIANMFKRLEENKISLEEAYNFAIDTLEANRHDYDFTESMKKKCITFMERVSEAFGGISLEEQSVIEKFKKDLTKF
ncbi:MAG: TerB family tellurite resistance protein [Cytophagaceae bacterium]|nr:TerB family tellurite resistance protein [Cytophagaceae bacterium]MDW8455219.1 TerB family tellurite resistance protein [Cytophagaceae bacterium]